jgi:KDO2-lipid IV(A) lauroyltransferase
MMTVFKILSMWPLWLSHSLGWILGWLVFLVSGTYRRRFLANARQAGLGWRQWTTAVGESGKQTAELPRLWLGEPVPVQWSGLEAMEAAMAHERGVVVLTPHIGCFEIVGQAYSQRYGHTQKPMTALFRPARQSWLKGLVSSTRGRYGLLLAPTTMAGVKQLIKALKQGQTLGLLPDQVPPAGLGVWADFFGQPAYTMTLSARLVQQNGAAVILAWGERLSWGRGYCVHFSPLTGDLPAESQLAAQAINHAMEGLILRCPHQYLWGYARYKQPRKEL